MTLSPKKKTSKSRSARRTSNWIKLTARKIENKTSINKDGDGLSHFMTEDGKYNGKKVLGKKKTSKKKKVARV